MELCVSPGANGLVSHDSDSLVVLAYIYLGNCPMKLNDASHNDSRFTKLPLLRHGGIETQGISKILSYLRSQNYGLEYGISDAESVELASLVTLIERQLTPAIDWFLWGEDEVFVKFTRPCYTASIGRLESLYLPFRWRAYKMDRTRHKHLTHCFRQISDTVLGQELYAMGKRCLTALSYILDKKKYFLADRPTAVDAYLFGRLWPLLLFEARHGTADWTSLDNAKTYNGHSASHPLVQHLLQCPNLVSHFIRIQNTYFPKAAASFRKDIALSHSKRQQTLGLVTAHPVRDCVVVGVGITVLFLMYARRIGLIRKASS
ncbi:hypothetical protein CRM22_008893 [Opisthorchis felineus]|uniref:Metaxin n=1 Tax=Opisthorchis felineus TaxID=147828 RepID=A0A4S2L9X5_OPIFE|nr:hypothetical protein CRM22_008893 [Opisthorchis felineus]